jgi:hypothetical protein
MRTWADVNWVRPGGLTSHALPALPALEPQIYTEAAADPDT